MPTNKNAMTRYKILDDLLSSRYHNYSLDDLTEEVNKCLSELYPDSDGVGRRTIEKDIFYLEYEGPFLVEIERYKVSAYNREKQNTYNKQCLRYARPSFSIFKKDLSNDEEYLLKEALSLLGQFDGLPNLEVLENLRIGLGVKKDERSIISLRKNPLENSNLFGELFTSISQKLVVELQYHKFSDPQVELKINVSPYLLKEYNSRWFLYAAAETDRKFLCFALDRIDKVTFLPSHTYFNYVGDINEKFEDIIGVTINDESPIYTIVFWASNVSKEYVATKPIHISQRSVCTSEVEKFRQTFPMLRGGHFFSIECKENYELIRELTSFGKEVVVLSPIYIRDKVGKWIDGLKTSYENLKSRT